MLNFKTLVCMFVLLGLSFSSYGGDPLKDAWEKLNNADIFESIKLFEKAANKDQYKEEALLMLSLLYQRVDRIEDATNSFAKYYELAEDPIPTSHALMYNEGVINTQGYKKDYNVKIHDMLLLDPRAKGKTLSSLLYNKGLDNTMKYQIEKTKENNRSIKGINDWAFVGPFDNAMNNGYNKDFGIIKGAKDDSQFKSRYGAMVNWFVPELDKEEGYVSLDSYFNDSGVQTYAQTFVSTKSTQEVIIHLAYSGTMKLWLNDHVIYTNNEVRATAADEYKIKTTFTKGNNRILLQVGDYKTSYVNFMVRITDINSNPISYTGTPKYSAYNTEKVSFEMMDHFAIKYFEEQLKNNPKSIKDLLLLARCYLKRGDSDKAESYYKMIEAIAPKNYFMLRDLVLIYSSSGNSTEQSKYYEIYENNYPEDKDVLENKLNEYTEQSKNDLLIETAQKYKALYPSTMSKLNADVRLLTIEENYMGIVALIDELYEAEPNNSEVVMAKYNVMKAMSGEDKAIEVLEKTIGTVFSGAIGSTLHGLYKERGQFDKAIEMTNLMLDLGNSDYMELRSLSEIYLQQKEFDKAIEVIEKILKSRPYDYYQYGELTKVQNFKGDKNAAINSYEKSLTYYPFDFMLNEKLREVKGQKGLLSLVKETDSEDIIVKHKKDITPDLSKDYEIAYQNISILENKWGARAKHQKYVIRINKEDAIEEWQQVNLSPTNSFSLIVKDVEVIKENGNTIAAERNGNNHVFVNLEVGDYIVVSFIESMRYGGKSSDIFYEEFGFDAYVPSYDRTFMFISENKNSIKYKSVNSQIEPKIESKNGLTFYTWSAKPKLLKYEVNTLAYDDIAQSVYITSNHNWDDIVQWYRDLSNQQAIEDYTITKLVDELGLMGIDSDMDKAKKIYDFILQNIQYSSIDFRQSNLTPQRASDVYHTRLGDCKDVSTLFAAIGRSAGLDVDLVLINTSNNGEKDIVLPSINFNHCIVKLNIENEDLYLELTDPFLPFGALYVTHNNARVLDIPFDKSKKSTLKKMTYNKGFKNLTYRKSTVTIKEDDELVIRKECEKTGNYGSAMTETYLTKTTEERKETLKLAFSSDFESPVTVNMVDFSNLVQRSPVAKYNYEISVSSELLKVGSFKSFKIPLSDELANIASFQQETRTLPFDFKFYETADRYEEEMNVVIEGDRTFLEVPENVKLNYQDISYHISFTEVSEHEMKINRVYTPAYINISPEDYPEFRAFMLGVIEAEKTHLVIK